MANEEELDHADTAVGKRHTMLDAEAGYALLAEKIWTALRDLGVERGRMYAFGDHAATLTGAPDPDTRTNYQEWVADIPPAGITSLDERITEAVEHGWLGEVDGLRTSRAATDQKLTQLQRTATNRGMPTLRMKKSTTG